MGQNRKTGIWDILQIEPTSSKRKIRKAYAAQAKKWHPEEYPDEFAKLQEAYQLALNNANTNNHGDFLEINNLEINNIEVVSEEPETTPDSSYLEALERGNLAEQKRRQREGALKSLIELFENTNIAKKNKIWSEFFLTDEFLKEYLSEEFAESLDFYLEHQKIYPINELPQGFLIEWCITYAMFSDSDGFMLHGGNVQMRHVIAKYWYQQDETWRMMRGTKILKRVENRARMRAFYAYMNLRKIEKQGRLTEENHRIWRDFLWQGAYNHVYEISKRTDKNVTSIIILKLFEYWVLNEDASLFWAKKMYKKYALKRNEKSAYYSFYKDLKEAILQKYPDIEIEMEHAPECEGKKEENIENVRTEDENNSGSGQTAEDEYDGDRDEKDVIPKPGSKLIKTYELKELSQEEKIKAVWDGLMLYAKHEKGGGMSEPVLPEEYPVLHPVFNEGGMGWLTDSFVVLDYDDPNVGLMTQTLYITVENYGCASDYLRGIRWWEEGQDEKLKARIRRKKTENYIMGGYIIREEYPEQRSSRIEPILFGESGFLYGCYSMARVCETKSAFELLSKKLDLEYAVRCEVYEGKMTDNYLMKLDKDERFENRSETPGEHYCMMR